MLLSYFQEFRPDKLKPLLYGGGRFLLAVSLLCVLPALLFEQQAAFLYIFGLTLLYAGYGGILLFTLTSVSGEGRLVRWLGGIGQSSYSVYLWHLPIAWFGFSVMQNRWHWSPTLVFWTYVAASLGIGIGMAHAIEYPVLRLRERLFPESYSPSSRCTSAQSVSFTGVSMPASAPRRAT